MATRSADEKLGVVSTSPTRISVPGDEAWRKCFIERSPKGGIRTVEQSVMKSP